MLIASQSLAQLKAHLDSQLSTIHDMTEFGAPPQVVGRISENMMEREYTVKELRHSITRTRLS